MNTNSESGLSPEAEIRELIAACDAALNDKNVEMLLREYDEEIVLFDVGTQVKGRDSYRDLWLACFPYFEDKIGTERKNLTIHVNSNLAFMHCLSRLSGMKSTEPMTKSWIRVTVCCKKIDGKWKVVHEHVSFPVNCESQQITYIFDKDAN